MGKPLQSLKRKLEITRTLTNILIRNLVIEATSLVDSVDLIKNLVDGISKLPADASILYIDLESIHLLVMARYLS